MGIEVQGEKTGKYYQYHVVNRPFELAELKLLVDAIQSSKITAERKRADMKRQDSILRFLSA